PRLEHCADGVDVALEVGDQHFDGAVRHAFVRKADGLGKSPGAEVREVVAVDRGEDEVAAATRAGSAMSYFGGRPCATAQYAQFLVQTSPRIMKVAVPCSQHSPTFGQCASSQTVCRSSSRMRFFR